MSKTTNSCIVFFNKDNCIEAVPDSRFFKKDNLCAWPVQTKHAKKIIVSFPKPNKKDFTFYSARKLGNKTYGELPFSFF